MSDKTVSVTYTKGPSGSVQVDSKTLILGGEPVSLSEAQFERVKALDGHEFATATTKKEK